MATKRMTAGFSDQVMSLVKTLRTDAPDCVAAGVVDMATGMLLAYETVDNHPPEVLDLLAGATLDLYQGRTVVMIEDLWKERRGQVGDDAHYFQEILVNSDHVTHLFVRMTEQQDVVAVVVCRKSVNVGMLLAQVRRVVREHNL
ncbi:hypothetical protein DI272_29260 [Streptomyces sp. Act143]|uniref:hypothetical protein n=1 Tax=Streptomyces sp. Act143 TaxID=2200760 RepID=UPI000D67910E|nr:hypothetical protein [Streptomyces sp. Act143]PWI17792.1 hypothetical protein DI272_29260 [Streptomyces sp. Act143]